MQFAKFEADSNQALLQSMADPQRFQQKGVDALIAPLKQHSLLKNPDALKSWLDSDDLPNDASNHRRKIIFRHATQAGIAEWQRLVAGQTQDHQPLTDSGQIDSLIAIAKECTGAKSSRALLFLESDQAALHGDQAKASELRSLADKSALNDDDEIYLESVRLMAERKWRLASQLLTSLADRDSVPSALRWTYLGRTQFQLGEFENAKLSLTQSLEHAATSSLLWLLRGTCCRRLNDLKTAEADFRQAIRLAPADAAGYLKLAEVLLILERPDEAYHELSVSLNATSNHVPTLLMRSRTATKLGKREEAEADRAAAYQATNLNAAELLYRSQQRLGQDLTGALKDIENAIVLAPTAPRLLHHLAKIQTKLGLTDQAIETLARIQTLSPDDDKATIDRAVLMARMKRSKEAELALTKAVKPSSPAPVLYQAACVYALLPDANSHVRALGYLSAAVQRGYGAAQLASDHDLDALHELPGYRAILKTVQLARFSDVTPLIPENYPPSELDYE